jgi:twinkle protein
MGIYSGKRVRVGSDDAGEDVFEIQPDKNGNIMCFPFFEKGVEVNTKYRAYNRNGDRLLWQRKGGIKTPYNIDCVLEGDGMVDLETGASDLVWVEGEPDCLVGLMAGFRHTISLPEGSVAARDHKGNLLPPVPEDTKDIDPATDDKFSFLVRLFEIFGLVRNHIIATDNDEAGQRMAKEIVRRIGAARCMMVTWPEEAVVPSKTDPKVLRPCKDLNDVLIHFGLERVRALLKTAKPWPVRGLYKLSDYPDEELPETFETGISPEFDEHFRIYEGGFAVVTGIPGSGKSTLVNQIAVAMGKRYRWPVTLFSGEMPVKPYLQNPLKTAFLHKRRPEWSRAESEAGDDFVERYFSFVDYSSRAGEEDSDIDIEFLLQRAADAVLRWGTKMLVIDPWNELDTSRRPGNVTQTEHDGLMIRKVKHFARTYRVFTFLVAHPTKLSPGEAPGLYSISGSANFANKAELGLVVHAPDLLATMRQAIVPKVKFPGTGRKGVVTLDFDEALQLFIPGKPDPMAGAKF